MPSRSKVAKLPPAIRDQLERRIIENAFGGYHELAEWLQQQGYQIADDMVQRYGARLHQRIESLDLSVLQAKAIAHAAPGDRECIVDSTIDMLNAQVFSTLLETEEIEQDDIVQLSRTVSQLSRISIARQKWAHEMKSLLNLDPGRQGARERGARNARAEAFAAVSKALLDPKAFRQDSTRAGPLNADILSAAESQASEIEEIGPAKPQNAG